MNLLYNVLLISVLLFDLCFIAYLFWDLFKRL